MNLTSTPNSVRGAADGLIAGFIGTTAMVTTTLLQHVLDGRRGPIDFDDSRVAIDLVERWTPLALSDAEQGVANQILRFGYGTTAGMARHLIDGRIRRPAVALFALTWGGETALLRSIGAAPSPWRWSKRLLLTSIVQHAIYAATTDIAYRTLRTEPPSTIDVVVDPDRKLR